MVQRAGWLSGKASESIRMIHYYNLGKGLPSLRFSSVPSRQCWDSTFK